VVIVTLLDVVAAPSVPSDSLWNVVCMSCRKRMDQAYGDTLVVNLNEFLLLFSALLNHSRSLSFAHIKRWARNRRLALKMRGNSLLLVAVSSEK